MQALLDAREQALHRIVKEAGAHALALFEDPAGLKISMKGAQDWLTHADGEVETLIRDALLKAFPEDSVMGEEQGGESGERLWIVDPIDGTANFARQDRLWCLSVGFVLQGVPTLGVVFAPSLGEFYSARIGQGAQMNGKPIHVAQTDSIDRSVVELGWSTRRPRSTYLDLVTRSINQGASVKRSASGALGMTHVAIGRTDCYAEVHINSWDVVAGLVIAQEAGARCNAYASGDWVHNGNSILCAQPHLYDAYHTLFYPYFD